jgi:hypothetical protein
VYLRKKEETRTKKKERKKERKKEKEQERKRKKNTWKTQRKKKSSPTIIFIARWPFKRPTAMPQARRIDRKMKKRRKGEPKK